MNSNELFGNQQNTGFVSFEEIENAFKTPTQRQADYEPTPDPSAGSGNMPNPPMGDLGHLADPTGEAFRDFQQIETEPTPQVDHEHAMRTGERIAKMADTAIDFTLSNFVARNNESYRADERDLQDIAECWGELAEEKGWNIGPELSLVILYIMVYGPLVKQAFVDRKMAELEARQKLLEDRMKAYEYQQPDPRTVQMPTDGNSETNPAPTPTASPFQYAPHA